MSFGERLSAFIIAECLKNYNIQAEFVDARKLIKTNNNFGSAKIDFAKTNKLIKKYFYKAASNKNVTNTDFAAYVITGFIGSTNNGQTTTLGRGGSDYTSSVFGAA